MSIFKELEEEYKYYVPRSKYVFDDTGIHKSKLKKTLYDYLFKMLKENRL